MRKEVVARRQCWEHNKSGFLNAFVVAGELDYNNERF
jgi:hypothetical protein